ncbi:MAG TPA: RDD family protein [Candidatus Kapabacteria bacterium]|nr:RDD family protein [Candidatus Kapabacteria bacterium]
MNYWDVLQLAPTTDIRAIKKAYAVLLKQNKPDENPEGFQRLHAAYQQAQAWAERHAEEAPRRAPRTVAPAAGPIGTDAPPETPNETLPAETEQIAAVMPDSRPPPAEPTSLIQRPVAEEPLPEHRWQDAPSRPDADVPLIRPEPTPVHGQAMHPHEEPLSAEEEAWENFLDQQWDSLVDQAEAVLEQPALRNDPRAWDFLVHAEALLDIEFKAEFSLRFLQRLVQIFFEQRESGELMLIPDTIRYLNNTFWWDQRRHHLEDHFEEDELDQFLAWWQPPPAPSSFSHAAKDAGPLIPYANYYRRWLALIIDGALLFACGWLINRFGHFMDESMVFAALFMIAAYAILNPLFESSPLQATPGKLWCRMKVCDAAGNRIPLWRALLRCALFGVSLYFLYITVIVNMLIWDGRLLHDRLSGSCVLRRQP